MIKIQQILIINVCIFKLNYQANIISDFGGIKYFLSDIIPLITDEVTLNKDNRSIPVSYFFLSLHWHKILKRTLL